MLYIGKFINNFKDFYNDINSATLTGAIDVIIVRQPDGSYVCSPFHVRFGKIGVLRSREKVVDIEVNGIPVDIHMKLGESGEAFFVEEVHHENRIPAYLATSPLPEALDIQKELEKMKIAAGLNVNKAKTGEQAPELNASDTTSEQDLVLSTNSSPIDVNQTCDIPDHFLTTPAHLTEVPMVDAIVAFNEDLANNNTDSSDEYKTKRKRRKKVGSKKRSKAKDIPSSKSAPSLVKQVEVVPTESDDKVEEIFQMDDDFEKGEDEGFASAGGLSRSVSLPVAAKIDDLFGREWSRRKMSSTFTGEFHPFSDGDVTPLISPVTSRPPSPKSDTEYENQKIDAGSSPDANGPSWGWGQLPNVPRRLSDTQKNADGSDLVATEKDVENATDAEKRSMLGGMLNFMRSTKKIRHMPESEGIYLSELNSDELDPELAALYFPKFKSPSYPTTEVKDEDTESGKGPSLPHSPHTVEGLSGTISHDSDSDERLSFDNFSKEKCESISYPYSDIAMSLCGGLQDPEVDLPDERFLHSLVTFDEFTENPAVLQDPNLVIRIGGKYYNWLTAASMLTSIIMFQRPLPDKTAEQLITEHMPKKKKKSYSSWWSWRRSESERKTGEGEHSALLDDSSASLGDQPTDSSPSQAAELAEQNLCNEEPENSVSIEQTVKETMSSVTQVVLEMQEETEPEPKQESKPEPENQLEAIVEPEPAVVEPVIDVIQPSDSSENSSAVTSPIHIATNTGSQNETQSLMPPENVAQVPFSAKEVNEIEGDVSPPKEQYMKSLRLTAKQIAQLNLNEGPNEFIFSVTTAYQGTTKCTCQVFLWNFDDKIVISDIDGTITKSDVLGHILPMVGHSWAQLGVAQLFTKIQANGYKFLYLSARAIGQARITREYLRKVRQGEICLPDGPLLLSPTSLISALHREVIERKPEEFKISCLKDIQTLFPQFMGNPFYAGFGNKINDSWAYRAVGIPRTRSFTINHRGELKLELIHTFQTSYTRLSDDVDHVFPPLKQSTKPNGHPTPIFSSPEEFSYFTYWREPVIMLSEEDISL